VENFSHTIRRAWTYVGVPELRSAYDPPFEDAPKIALPYVSVRLCEGERMTPRIEARLSSSDPYCIFPREVFAQLGIEPSSGLRARDPQLGDLRLCLVELHVFGDSGAPLVTRARVGCPGERDAPEPILGSFGFFSVFHVAFSPRRGIAVRARRPK
jgi:hypothetical protein